MYNMNEKPQQCVDGQLGINIQFTPSSLSYHQSNVHDPINSHDSLQDEKIDSHSNITINDDTDRNKRQTEMNTVIVFDYDDTIFPSTAIKNIFKRYNPINDISKWNLQELLQRITISEWNDLVQLSVVTYHLLSIYTQKYSMENIFIVSAAKPKWFKHSLSIIETIGCYKQIGKILKNFKITKLFDGSVSDSTNKNPTKWKYNKFESILKFKKFFSDKNENKIDTFVSIGDSAYEYHAAGQLKNINDKNNKFFVHRIKLIDHPSLNHLYAEQYKLCQSCLYFERYSMVFKTNVDQNYQQLFI